MSALCVDHIALTVESLRQAENLYTQLLGLQVLFREGNSEQGWGRWTADTGWDTVSEEGITIEQSCLGLGDVRLLLMRRPSDCTSEGRINHVCLRVTPDEMKLLLQRARHLDCRMEQSPSCWIMEDPYGVKWRLMTEECVLE